MLNIDSTFALFLVILVVTRLGAVLCWNIGLLIVCPFFFFVNTCIETSSWYLLVKFLIIELGGQKANKCILNFVSNCWVLSHKGYLFFFSFKKVFWLNHNDHMYIWERVWCFDSYTFCNQIGYPAYALFLAVIDSHENIKSNPLVIFKYLFYCWSGLYSSPAPPALYITNL